MPGYTKYNINITYQPNLRTGWTTQQISGATYTVAAYSGNYYVASILELGISATSTDPIAALSSILIAASASTSLGLQPLSNEITG
jgi:hypothetical protein